jgi:thiol-disulfide isomerase/thioredoxin/outer membrane lipoprotein-sorting protein
MQALVEQRCSGPARADRGRARARVMKTRHGAWCARLLCLGMLAAGSARPEESAMDLLRKVSLTYRGLKSYHFESVEDRELHAEMNHSWERSTEVLVVVNPSKVRFETKGPGRADVIISDGTTMWRVAPDTREFVRSSVVGPILETEGGGPIAEQALHTLRFAMARWTELDQRLEIAQVVGGGTVRVGEASVECTIVQASYDAPVGSKGIGAITRTYWIDASRRIILQERAVTLGRLDPNRPFEEMESTSLVRYTIASLDEPPSDSLFVYTPPVNFKEVDRLDRALGRPPAEMIGQQAPELTLRTLDGAEVVLSSLRGKPVLLDFWATWCRPCRDQMPAVAKLYEEASGQGLVLLGVDDDEGPEKALRFTSDRHYGWPNLYDGAQHEGRGRYKVESIPALVLIDKQGVIVEYQVGFGPSTEAAIRRAVQSLGIHIRP